MLARKTCEGDPSTDRRVIDNHIVISSRDLAMYLATGILVFSSTVDLNKPSLNPSVLIPI